MEILIKRTGLMTCIMTGAVLAGSTVFAADIGEAGFREHCVVCHADGGNIIKPDKTLSRKALEKNGIKKARDIVKLMRNPGEGMTAFDRKTIPDKQAKAIADYVLKTFK